MPLTWQAVPSTALGLKGQALEPTSWVMPCHHNLLALHHGRHLTFCTSTPSSVNGNTGIFPMTLWRDKWIMKGTQLMSVKKTHTKLFESQFPLLYDKEKNYHPFWGCVNNGGQGNVSVHSPVLAMLTNLSRCACCTATLSSCTVVTPGIGSSSRTDGLDQI